MGETFKIFYNLLRTRNLGIFVIKKTIFVTKLKKRPNYFDEISENVFITYVTIERLEQIVNMH